MTDTPPSGLSSAASSPAGPLSAHADAISFDAALERGSVVGPDIVQERLQGRFPRLLDVRREERYLSTPHTIRGAVWRRPEAVDEWASELSGAQPIIVFCVFGHEVSQNVAARLRARGLRAAYLQGGFAGWAEAGGQLSARPDTVPSRWITRSRPKIDRIACPWLVKRFINPDAAFFYVPTDQVRTSAAELAAEPFDITGVAYSHQGERCSFDTFIEKHGLHDDPALMRLAEVVRGADTDRLELAPEAAGLLAVSLGLSVRHADDLAMLEAALPVYDAFYARFASAATETHTWRPAGAA